MLALDGIRMMRVPFRSSASSLLVAPGAFAQNWGRIEGRVTQQTGGSPIPGATVVVAGTSFGTAAENDGAYTLRLPTGRYALRITAIGFQARTDSVTVLKDRTTRLDIALAETDIELGGVEVEGSAVAEDAGVFTIDPRTAQNIPAPAQRRAPRDQSPAGRDEQ